MKLVLKQASVLCIDLLCICALDIFTFAIKIAIQTVGPIQCQWHVLLCRQSYQEPINYSLKCSMNYLSIRSLKVSINSLTFIQCSYATLNSLLSTCQITCKVSLVAMKLISRRGITSTFSRLLVNKGFLWMQFHLERSSLDCLSLRLELISNLSIRSIVHCFLWFKFRQLSHRAQLAAFTCN